MICDDSCPPQAGQRPRPCKKKQRLFHTSPFLTFHNSTTDSPRCPNEPCRQAQGIIAIQHIELQCSLRQLQSLRYLGNHDRCRFQVLRPSWFGNLTSIKIAFSHANNFKTSKFRVRRCVRIPIQMITYDYFPE